MRIGIVVEYLHGRGGTQRQALELARMLGDLGHDVVVLTRVLDRKRCFPELLATLEVRSVHDVTAKAVEAASSSSRVLARRFAEKIGIHDVVAMRTMRASARELVALLEAAASEQPFDVLNAHDYGPAAWAVARCRGPVKVWQCNDPVFRWSKAPGLFGGATRAAAIAYDRRRSHGFDAITVLDHAVARVVERRFGMTPKVVRSGVDVRGFAALPPRREARERLELDDDAFVVLVLSLLHSKHRRAEDAIALAERLPASTRVLLAATVVDPGSAYTHFIEERLARSSAKDRVLWRREPLRGESELHDLYAAADVFYFPNERQTWGLSVIEACAAKLPVVVSDGAGAHEVIDDGKNGFVFRVGDIDQATEKVVALADPALRHRIGEAAQDLARTMSWQDYARAMLATFDDARSRRKV